MRKQKILFLDLILSTFRYSIIKKKKKYNRVLPIGECLIDRIEKAKICGFGVGTTIYDSAIVIGNVVVGCNTWIGPWVMLDGSGGLSIGSNCAISAGVQIYSHDTVNKNTSGGSKEIEYSRTVIGDDCYIGPNVIISKGVIIGSKVIIGANSFVNKDIPSNSKAFGIPAVVKRQID